MDKTLAEIYGTNQVEEADVEKLAAAELAEQLTETGDAQIDEETLEALAQEVLAQEDEQPEEQVEVAGDEATEEQAVSEPEMDEAQEKIAEADYLGRVMAHSFVQESREIEKQAMQKKADLGDVVPNHPSELGMGKGHVHGEEGGSAAWTKEHGVAGKGVSGPAAKPTMGARARGAKMTFMKNLKGAPGVSNAAKWGTRGAVGAAGLAGAGALAYGAKKAFGSKEKRSSTAHMDAKGNQASMLKDFNTRTETTAPSAAAAPRQPTGATGHSAKADSAAKKALESIKGKAGKVGAHIAKNKKWYGGGAAAALAAGGGAYAAKKYKEKRSSAVDTLAEQRALEVLAEAGYDVDEVLSAVEQYQAAPEKTAEAEGTNAYDVLAETVEARAEEMLNELVEAGIIAVPEEQE